jgi:hypothetical protein
MDSAGAGGIFGHAYFIPPICTPKSESQEQSSLASGGNVAMRGCDELGTAVEDDERRTKLGFQSLGAAECESCMRNHTQQCWY